MSLKRIAEMTGVSVSTVSRVLNNQSETCASEEVKARVWEAAREIRYVPNAAARRLKMGEEPQEKPVHIQVVLARVKSLTDDPFFGELSRELEIEIFRRGFTGEVRLSADGEIQGDFPECDGMIILGRCLPEQLSELSRHTKNLVGIWRNPRECEIDEVVCDGKAAAREAVSYLIGLGHRQIGYIGDCSYESRYVGYMETLLEHQLPLDYSRVIATSQTREEGYAGMKRLLKTHSVTAVLCANDVTALGALDALAEEEKSRKSRKKRTRQISSQNILGNQNIRSSQNCLEENDSRCNDNDSKISVISIDNIREAQATRPLLTTVDIPRQDMAHMAVTILYDRIMRGHTHKLKVEFPCRIVERDSCFRI